MGKRAAATGLACWIVIAAVVGPARADLDQEGGGWLMAFANGSFAPASPDLARLRWWFDLQPRFTTSSDLDQLLVRPGFGYDVGGGASLWLGYAYVINDPPSRSSFDEHRIWQQLLWSTKWASLGFQSRTRLEQRILETGSDTGWRLRQFVKLTHPLAFDSRLGVAGYEEVLVDFNDTDWGADAGFAQNRLFAGLSWKLEDSGRAVVELGYLNVYNNTTGRADVMLHLGSLNLLLNLP